MKVLEAPRPLSGSSDNAAVPQSSTVPETDEQSVIKQINEHSNEPELEEESAFEVENSTHL